MCILLLASVFGLFCLDMVAKLKKPLDYMIMFYFTQNFIIKNENLHVDIFADVLKFSYNSKLN